MKAIKGALAECREEEQKAWSNGSKTFTDWLFGKNPKKVIEEIDPAINKVNIALKTLGANSSKLGYTIAASAAGVVAAASIAIFAVWLMNNGSQNEKPVDLPNVPADGTTNDATIRLQRAKKTAEAAYNDADSATQEAVKNANLINESSNFYSEACDAASAAAAALGDAALALSDTNDAARRSDVLSAEIFAAEANAAAHRANAAAHRANAAAHRAIAARTANDLTQSEKNLKSK